MTIRPTIACPCDGRFLQAAAEYHAPPAGETPFDFGGQAYARGYDRCGVCDHWFGRHALDLSTLYDRSYVDSTYGGAAGMQRRFEHIMRLDPAKSDNRQRATRVRGFATSHGIDEGARPRLLDVGAGLGVFPAAMREAGWEVTAIEPDARTVVHLRDVVGVRAIAVDAREFCGTTSERFEVVSLNKVLEHVENPLSLLAAVGGLLVPAGFVYVEVPDVAAIAEGPGREEFFVEHHHVFSPASLVMLGARARLSVVELERLREPSSKFTVRAFFVPDAVRTPQGTPARDSA